MAAQQEFSGKSNSKSDSKSQFQNTKEIREILKKSEFLRIEFEKTNPHTKDSKVWQLYEEIKSSKTVKEAKESGASIWDLGEYCKKGHLKIEGIRKTKQQLETIESKESDKEDSNSDNDKKSIEENIQKSEESKEFNNPKENLLNKLN